MIWLTWRQFRVQALVAGAALAALTAYLVWLGLRIRQAYELNVECGAGCSVGTAKEIFQSDFASALLLCGLVVILVPALIGAFWGAPLVARELETGTHRLVWNQSITRTRWLAVKLGFVALAGMALTGALSVLLTWAASPYDQLIDSRFEPLFFPTRNVAPLGYAAFAVVAGAAIGLLARRSIPAMAITLAAFAVLQVLVPATIRPHFQPAVTETVALDAVATIDGIGSSPDGVRVLGFGIQGAWVLAGDGLLLDAAGDPISQEEFEQACDHARDDPGQHKACITQRDLHFTVTYQPADRYWTFQWFEFGAYLVLASLLAGFAFWRIRRTG